MIQQTCPRPWRVNLHSNIHDAGNRYIGQMYRRADALLVVEAVNATKEGSIPNELMELLKAFFIARCVSNSASKGHGAAGIRETSAALCDYLERLFPKKALV